MAASYKSLTPSKSGRTNDQPGGLLDELERRQDDVLEQLNDLDAKLSEVLKGLEPEPDASETEDSAEDWA